MSDLTFKVTWSYTPPNKVVPNEDYLQKDWNETLMTKINQIYATLFQEENKEHIERDITSKETKGVELYADRLLRPIFESMSQFDEDNNTLAGKYNVHFVADNGNRIYMGKNKRGEIEVLNYYTLKKPDRFLSNKEAKEELLELLNNAWGCVSYDNKPTYSEFNCKVPVIFGIDQLRKLERWDPALGLSSYNKPDEGLSVQGLSVLSIIATITEKGFGDRLAVELEDDDELDVNDRKVIGFSWFYEENPDEKPTSTADIEKDDKNLRKRYNALHEEAKALKNENESLKNSLEKFRKQQSETTLFNSNLTCAMSLFMDHSLTKEEMQEIMEKFDKEVNTLEESKELYKHLHEKLRKRSTKNEDDDLVSRDDIGGLATDSKMDIGKMKVYKVVDYRHDHTGEEVIVLKDINGNVTHYDPTCGIFSLKKVVSRKVYDNIVDQWNNKVDELKIE